MDRIMEQLSKLQELSNDELSELEDLCISEFETAKSAGELSSDSVATMTKLADAVEATRTEKSRRVAEAQALEEAAAAAAARVAGPAEAEAGATPMDEADDEMPDGTTPADTDPADAQDDENPDDTKFPPPGTATASTETPVEAEAAAPPMTPAEKAKDDAEDKADGGKDEDKEAYAAAPETAVVETPAEPEPAAAEAAAAPAAPAPAPVAEAAVAEAPEAPAEAPATATEASEAPAPEPETEATAEASNENIDSQEGTVTADAAQGELAIEPPAGRQPQIKPATTLSITAGADVPGFSAGAKLSNDLEVADAFQRRLHSLRHVHGGDGEQHIVASYRQEFPSDRSLSANDPMENTDKIQGVTSSEAITAAAGICLPLETRYDLGCDVGVTDRPVRDALARFGSDRGGIRFFSAPLLADSAAATGFWRSDGTGANWHTYGPNRTTATSPADAKPCLEVQCTTEAEAYIEAVTLCLTFNNLTTRTFPELIKRHNELALVAHARIAENALIAQLKAGSTAVSMPAQVVGAARELFNVLGLAVASLRHKHRMSTYAPLRMVVPAWVRDFVRADLTLQMPGDGIENTIGVADAKIDAWMKARGVNVTWHLDGVGPAVGDLDDAGSGTANGFEWPTTFEFGLWPEGTWLFLDGGTLDLGVIRDSSLVATNQYKQFVETFEGVANIGCESYWMTTRLTPTGQAAALVDTLP